MSNPWLPSGLIMRTNIHLLALIAWALTLTTCMELNAQEVDKSTGKPAEPKARELLVPFNDLPLLLGKETRRVFMTREELASLKAAAKLSPEEALPQQTAVLSAAYDAQLESGRATLVGQLQIEVLGDGLHALPLNISGVGIRAALLDDQPAALAHLENGQLQLIVQGKGMHRLKLEMVLPVATAAAQQSLSWTVPVPPATRMHLVVPGNVEMKTGASVLNRRVDAAAAVTHFDLLPTQGAMNLVMSLNNKRLRDETTILARGVLISEITQGYQRLHANLSMNVLHGAADEFRIGLPEGYEVTQVTSPLLARWSVEDSADAASGKVLVVKLTELASERTTIQLRADRLQPQLGQWQMPRLEPLKVAGFASVVGILIEDQLASQSITSQQLIPVDNQILTAALPASVLAQEPGAPRIRPLATFYAAQAEYTLATSFNVEPAELKVTTNVMLTLGDRGLEVNGAFALLPSSEKLFAFDFVLPSDWQVDSINLADGKSLNFEQHQTTNGGRVRVQLPGGLAPGSTQSVLFRAHRTPAGWLSEWTEQTIELPQISIAKTPQIHETGVLTVLSADDLTLQPEGVSGLIVISDSEKSKYGCANVPLNFAWRYTEEPWHGSLKVARATPRITGRALSFFQVSHDALTAHYELLYDVDQASAQRVSFSLPETTPVEITVRGLGDTVVKETSSQTADARRVWTVQLADKKIGRIRLAIDFTQPIAANALANWTLPTVRTENVAYQSGLVAVEGHAELDINVSVHPRTVDMGELVDAEYQVGSRLLGVYSYVGNAETVTIIGQRRAMHGLPTTIVQRAELVSLIGAGSVSQTAARFRLRTKAQYLEVRLPDEAKLWSIMVDGLPSLPERQADRIVVALKSSSAEALRDVQVVYEHPINPIGLRSRVELLAPSLWHRADRDTSSEPVPLVDLHWEAVLPTGYRLVQHAGTVTIENTQPSPWSLLTRWLPDLRDFQSSIELMKAPAAARELPDVQYMPAPMSEMAQTDSGRKADAPASQDPFGDAPAPIAPPAPAVSAPAAPAQVLRGEMKPAQAGQAGRQMATWAIEGLRCLNIDLTPAKFGESINFASLGVNPSLRVTLINQRRWHWLGAACGLALFIIGLARVRSSIAARLKYALLMIFSTLLIALGSGWIIEMQPVMDAVIASAVALVVLTILVAVVRGIYAKAARLVNRTRTGGKPTAVGSTTATLLALAIFTASTFYEIAPAYAQDSQATPVSNLAELAALIDALPGSPSMSIPADAIVIPYDSSAAVPEHGTAVASDPKQKLLVPYETYVQLWNAAHPVQRLTTKPPVVPYAWSAAQYETTLRGDEALEVNGSFKIELYSDAGLTIPFTLAGGLLQSITVDGQPARVQLIEPQPPTQVPQGQATTGPAATEPTTKPAFDGQASAVPTTGVMLLHLSGKGIKEIKLVVRMKIERRGGWRVIDGRLPVAPATGLTLHVPEAETEVRLTSMTDRATHEIASTAGRIETALPADGRAAWQWRAKIAEAAMDQGLSVDAKSVFDIQEDGLRLSWQGNFEFRRGRRESFTLLIPGDYLVQKVLGSNIRGWNVKPVGDSQQLTIDLLASVAERETLLVQLFRKHNTQTLSDIASSQTQAAAETISAPVIRVPDAMLQKGQLTIRRSRLLDLRSGASSGLARIDTPDNSPWLVEQSDASPVPLVPFQAFQYSQVPYSYQLTAQPLQTRVQVIARTLLHLSELESALESQLILNVSERQLYRVRVSVPKNWKLLPPTAPIAFEWNRVVGDNDQTLEINFTDGVIGSLPIVLRGPLEQTLAAANDGIIPNVVLPKIVVQDVSEQSGDIVVVADPAFAVRADQLQNCELGLLGGASGWVAPQQQPLAQLLVHYSRPDIAGQLQIARRVPQVTGYSISNIKVTDRSIEETLFFEFTIRTAGIRQISLVVPANMARCRVRGPLIRSQTWTPTSPDAGAPVRLVVDLQEEVMGQYSLILEHDRLLSSGVQTAPISTIETGKTEHRFITLENSGRDELLIDQTSGMERLQRSQSQWNVLANLLGGKTNEAFVVNDQATDPKLTFNTKDRAMIETVGARIGIAQTLMIVDENGAYRTSTEFRVENRTEQYLEIELPVGAQLWTVTVAGEPVKPMTTTAPAGSGPRVRLPLVKTASGDLDYIVLIKYGGQLPRPRALSTTRFPLVKTININVELSQVRLRLPAGLKWWNFGGSMSRVQSEDELTAGWLAFRTRQLTDLTQMLSKSAQSDFSRARALSNLKQLGTEVQQYQIAAQGRDNEDLQRQLASNGAAWFEAQKELAKPTEAISAAESSNRFALNSRLQLQQNERSTNVANPVESNFDRAQNYSKSQAAAGEFDAKWLAGNSLKGIETKDEGFDPAKSEGVNAGGGRLYKGKKSNMDASGSAPAKPMAPPVQPPSEPLQQIQSDLTPPQAPSEDRAAQVFRYQQQLERRSNAGRGGMPQSSPAPSNAPTASSDPFASGGMGGGIMGGTTSTFDFGGQMLPPNLTNPVGPGNKDVSQGYLVSLDTQLPVRGDEFLFTTPRGATEITAQSISTNTLERWSAIVGLLLLGLIAWGARTFTLRKATSLRRLRM